MNVPDYEQVEQGSGSLKSTLHVEAGARPAVKMEKGALALAALAGGLVSLVLVLVLTGGDGSPAPLPPAMNARADLPEMVEPEPEPAPEPEPEPEPDASAGCAPAGAPATPVTPTRVLFSGNSYTYGPPQKYPDTVRDGGPLNNLPRLFKLVAESLGDQVETAEDTMGGCTNYAHRPSACPLQDDPQRIAPGCERVIDRPISTAEDGTGHIYGMPRLHDDANSGLTYSELRQCAMPCAHGTGGAPDGSPPAFPSNCSSTITASRGTYHPCPQLWDARFGPASRGKPFDFMVFQTHSALPGIARSRELMMRPAAAEMAEQAQRQGAKLVAYMTWGYPNGSGLDYHTGQRGGTYRIGQYRLSPGAPRGDNNTSDSGHAVCG
jgi:hypothetical protein